MAPTATRARRYAPGELLKLRNSLPFVTCAIKKLNQHPDLACILRIPEGARKDPEHFSCKSRMLVEITNRAQSQQADRRRAIESSHESECQSLPDVLGNQESAQFQWALRQRDSSERSSQPYSAPTEIAAQRSENFQRFYRAVVSPTHVRVTAGGRIVPNTRATAPPALEWNNDKSSFEPIKKASGSELNSIQQKPWPTNPQLNAGYAPLIPSTFLPPHNLLPRGNSLSLPTMASQLPPSISGTERSSIDHGPTPQLTTEAGANPMQPGLIKLSPPGQFDQFKPFMYNGQFLVPIGPANAVPHGPHPFAMLGNSPFYPPTPMAPTGFMQHPFHVTMPNMPSPMVFPAGHHPTMMAPNTTAPSEGMLPMSSFLPMPGMALTSDVLNGQIPAMRIQLKNLENHISNNKGQFDHAFLERERGFLLAQISNMEAMLDNQRAHEAKNVKGTNGNGNGSGNGYGATMSHDTSQQPSKGTALPAQINRQPPAVVSSSTVASRVEKNEQEHTIRGSDSIQTRSEPATKSRLTIAAALAPPFQPRSQTFTAQNNQTTTNPSPSADIIALLEASPNMQADIEAGLISTASGGWNGSAVSETYVTLSRGHTFHGEQVEKSSPAPTLQRSSTFHGPTNVASENKFVMPLGSVPYLVGTLPSGVNATLAKATDFVYSRPLTDEEVRARYLYWGKAPRSVQSGLPKFDGKDFYPPSPVKGKVGLATNTKEVSPVTRAASPAPTQDPSFEHMFASPWSPGYKLPSPTVTGPPGWVTLGPVPVKPVFKNGNQKSRITQSHGSLYNVSKADSSTGTVRAERQEGAVFRSQTTPYGATSSGEPAEDFSGLFLEGDAPRYQSPSPPTDNIKETIIYYNEEEAATPVTPQNQDQFDDDEGDDEEVRTQDSWERGEAEAQYLSHAAQFGPSQSFENDVPSSASTVEFHLGPRENVASVEKTYEERVENFKSTEQQTLFLQNILKNEPSMVGSALSGTISSATAQGYLPPYRGSAAASLTPTAMNLQHPTLDVENIGSKHDAAKPFSSPTPAIATSFLSENRPFNSERFPRATVPPNDAEAYMRYLALKDENNKQIFEQGWNPETTGTGSVSGSNW
ncbi:hypothetical protein EG329_011221 [Mollisiaceae sp. DMI_Dod_QoI]|nr:hypothetical protein EG329_011221 [Helotiales sp. DMI_Dod_QoI]